MADNKQYITQNQESGSVMISEDVISTIVIQSVAEVEGVVGLGSKSGEVLAKKNQNKGLRITITPSDALKIECNVIIAYGQSVVAVAKAVQEAIGGAIDSMTGIAVESVNVNVCGIVG